MLIALTGATIGVLLSISRRSTAVVTAELGDPQPMRAAA